MQSLKQRKIRKTGKQSILKESIMTRTTRKITDNPVVCRIVDLIRKQGKKERNPTDHIGIAPGAMSKWK